MSDRTPADSSQPAQPADSASRIDTEITQLSLSVLGVQQPSQVPLDEEKEAPTQPRPAGPPVYATGGYSRFLAYVRYYLPERFHRPLVGGARRFHRLWFVNSGNWQWLEQKPLPLKLLNRNLWRNAEPSANYYIMLFLSGVISTLGLLAGSTAAIIGAMIVAPLMGPIIGVAFSITVGNQRLLKRAGFGVITGAVMTVVSAFVICQILGINTLNPEIMARTRPTLIDLAIGLAAGAAGAFATTRREVASALPGVAIAVALVPPLSVIGIGLAYQTSAVYQSEQVVLGSTILFLTNLSGIILSGGLIFIWQDYGSIKRAKRGLSASVLITVLLGIPLGISMRNLVVEERARSLVSRIIRRRTLTFRDTDIRRLTIDRRGTSLYVEMEVATTDNDISRNQVNLVRKYLEQELNRPIQMNVRIVPVEEYLVGEPPSDGR